MKRDLKNLSEKTYDVIIAGGGIYGLTLAWELSRRGLRTALVEKNDFGSGTSANSLKTIHGGLRYLQQLDIKRMRESITERTLLMYMMPHLVYPLNVLLPTYGYMMKGSEVMRAGMLLNDFISMDRNWTGDPAKKIPAARLISKRETLRLVPGLKPDGVRGAALWTDAQMMSSERVGLNFLLSAMEYECDAANHVAMTGLRLRDGRVEGIRAEDKLTGDSFDIQAPVVINATGGWLNKVLGSGGLGEPLQLSTAMNLIIHRRLLPEAAAGVYGHFTHQTTEGPYHGRHVLFLAPWREYTIAGTYHRPYTGDPDDLRATEEEIHSFLDEVNSAIPGNKVQREEISFFHKGFLPMDGVNESTGEVKLTKQYTVTDHGKNGGPEGLISIIGVKYTTARDISAKVAKMVAGRLGKKEKVGRRVRLKGGEIERYTDFVEGALKSNKRYPESVIRHLIMQYGSEYKSILADAEKEKLTTLIPGSSEVIAAEIIHAIRNEMALALADVLLRRTDLGSGECPGDETINACAKLMAGELGWDRKKTESEITAVKDIYKTVG